MLYSLDFSMNELTKHIARACRCKTLLALFFVLALAAGADRMAVAYGPLGMVPTESSLELTAVDPPRSDVLPENMAGSGKPIDESTVCLQVPVGLKSDNGNGRSRHYVAGRTGSWVSSSHQSTTGFLCATISSIDSDLGRQFTLVGARPSGTS
jgi:hypothetical protein